MDFQTIASKHVMKQIMTQHLVNILAHWTNADVRSVPGVMYQVRYARDEQNIEYRFHLFINTEETYIHNHRYDFISYCIQSEYNESLWNIGTSVIDRIAYVFPRNSGNDIGSSIAKQGELYIENERHHFPDNVLRVTTNQFLSISPAPNSTDMVMTFVARHIHSTNTSDTFIWSDEKYIQAPTDSIRPATPDERDSVYEELNSIHIRHCNN